jgi:effector-binding domain-containing protein
VSYEVVELTVPARATAVVAETTTWEKYPQLWGRLLEEVWAAVRSDTRIAPGRNVMLYKDQTPSVEVGVEVDGPFEPIGRVVPSTLPAGRVATTTHRGSWDVGPAHRAITDACDRLGLERLGPLWEIYGHWNKPGDEEVEIYHLVR